MPQRLTFEYNPLSYAYPDNELPKELSLQAPGTGTFATQFRAAFLYWVNMDFPDGEEVWQVVRLSRRERGDRSYSAAAVHKYVYPDMIVVDRYQREHNVTHSLGWLTRDQREALLECADEVPYDGVSDDEGLCARWMSELLESMVRQGLVARGDVDEIRDAVSLPLPSSSNLGLIPDPDHIPG